MWQLQQDALQINQASVGQSQDSTARASLDCKVKGHSSDNADLETACWPSLLKALKPLPETVTFRGRAG